jgi:signal transduction histidine kinase/CheY-like chemotaxis protein
LATLGVVGEAQTVGYLTATGLVWSAAIMSWLSSQNLRTALEWATDSQRRAWETAYELRERRGQLRSALQSLETTHDLLGHAKRELERANERAQEAHAAKSRFVANISHELRTPLNVILGFAELFSTSPESYGDFEWPTQLCEDLFTVWRNAEHLLHLVDDVLDLAQIEVSRLPIALEATELDDLIIGTVDTVTSLLRDSRVELRMALPGDLPTMALDRTRIRQVLLNLINNAIRHTQNGFIEVGAYRQGDDVVVYVKDTGEGIPGDKLGIIFREFEQADTSTRRPHQGAGLGLAIARHLVSLHGGRIWAESQVGKGSTFSFSIPLLAEVDSSPPPRLRRTRQRGASGTDPSMPVVALGEDRLAIRLLQRHLGQPVLRADSLANAAELVGAERPQAVLMVHNDPAESTKAALEARALLRMMAPAVVPVIVCRIPTESRAAHRLRAQGVLIKPVSRGDVVDAISRICARPRRIALVDDEADMVQLLHRIISTQWPEAQVLTATSGEEALQLARRQPDVMLLDLLMPGTSGLDVLGSLREDSNTSSVPVLVITARGPEEDLDQLQPGEFTVVRGRGFTAEETVAVLRSVISCLPASYLATAEAGTDTPRNRPA